MYIRKIKDCFKAGKVFYSRHAKIEMENEEFGRIFESEVYEAVLNGEVIEQYLKDKPYPSYLIFGTTKKERPLHIVCAYNEDEKLVIIITVYHPNPKIWIEHKRREK